MDRNLDPDALMRDAPAPDALASRPLRVLVTGYRSHPHVGGQGVYIHELTRGLRDLGHEVTVASGPPYPELPDGVALEKLPSLDLFAEENAFFALRWKHLSSWADLSEWLAHNTGAFGELYAFGRRLDRFLAEHADRFDVVHDNQTLSTPFERIEKRLPLVTTLHHPIAIDRRFAIEGARDLKGRLLTRRWHRFVGMQARTSRRLSHFLAVSRAARDSHAELYGTDPDRVKIAFNGIDHGIFHPDPATPREPGLIVTTASADTAIKGLDVLIEAFARIAADRPLARLLIVGRLRDGPARRALEARGLIDRVETRSGLTREAIADLYRRAAIVACPARFEGFGFPAAEAMACGAPVAASDGGALPEVVGETGLVSPAGDAEAFSDSLAALLDDPAAARSIGEAASVRARDAFDWTAHARAATALYLQAISERQGAC